MIAATLPALIQRFFTDRLCSQMEASHHTVAGYRDTFRLLLRFASARHGKPPVKLTVSPHLKNVTAFRPVRCLQSGGMETGFGGFLGNQNTLSAVATLAYDCHRTAFFTEQLYAAHKLFDRGVISASSKGPMHGEVGQTQFLPKNILLYGADGDGSGGINLNSKADALASTAKFLAGHGWPAGEGYQPGQANFSAIQAWNAATVYQKAIARHV